MSTLTKTKQKNELIKRKYLRWMQQAQGFSTKTIATIEKALWRYEEFTEEADYAEFSSRQAEKFKKFLATNINNHSGIKLGPSSQYQHLRHVRNFFLWLASQPGYRSRVSLTDVTYLQLSKKERRKATTTRAQKYPSLTQVIKLCSFEVKNEIDMRDRALIAFTALSGMRDQAIVTVPIGCFDVDRLVVEQDPLRGVETKFSKSITTALFRVDEQLIKYVTDWYHFLVDKKKLGNSDPLFPSTDMGFAGVNHYAFEAKGTGSSFWAGADQLRKIFRSRSVETGVPYFTPHKFRHFIINEVKKHITSMEQLKAISQNLGHENIATTFHGYGAIDTERVNELVSEIDFSGLPRDKSEEALANRTADLVIMKMQKHAL